MKTSHRFWNFGRLSFFLAFILSLLAVFCALDRIQTLESIKNMLRPLVCRIDVLFKNCSFCMAFVRNRKKLASDNGNMVQMIRNYPVGYFVEPIETNRWWNQNEDFEEDCGIIFRSETQLAVDETLDDNPYDTEALAILQVAIRFRNDGKLLKAKRIIEHALVLAPTHPDILTEYGLFVENVHGNVVQAQSYYTKACVYNPWHQAAIANRQRTLPLVEEIDNRMLREIDEKREWFMKIPRGHPNLRRAMKDSYFAHIYHTVAIEGNTMSLVQTRSILETRLAVGGKSIVEHNEILGMDSALRFINRTLVHRIGEIDIQDLLEIHRRILGFVDPLQAGQFRANQVYVGRFTPVAPELLRREMDEFLLWLNADDTLIIHPVELAALAHYKFVYIHPFIDGNGRTARLLMNLILMQAGFPPVIIRVEDRLRYYETLQQANEGDLRPFIRFVASTTDETLQQYIQTTGEGPRQGSGLFQWEPQIIGDHSPL